MASTVSPDLAASEYEEIIDDDATRASKINQLTQLVKKHKGQILVYTGAGLSTSAGIADFRSGLNSATGMPAGKWCRQATEEQWTDSAAEEQKIRVRVTVPTTQAVPTPSHMALVSLQQAGVLKGLISQNCDGLHRRSGFPPESLAELHGNSTIEYCGWCGKEYRK